MKVQDTVNVYLCRDQRDCEMNRAKFAHKHLDEHHDVKMAAGNKLIINGKWNVFFTSQASGLDGMHINEIDISTGLATSGDIHKLTSMLNAAREGRWAMKNEQEKEWTGELV